MHASPSFVKSCVRFLHDCVTATINAVDTGFAVGLFEGDELDSKSFTDKAGKCAFLDKIFNYVGICLGERLDTRSAKVVAGLEPLYTCLFLAHMGRVASNGNIDHSQAVERTLNNEAPGDRVPPMKGSGAVAMEAAQEKVSLRAAAFFMFFP